MGRELRDLVQTRMGELPLPGTCVVRITLSRHKFCGRQAVEGSEFCYWHYPDLSKYEPAIIARCFGKEITLAQALENEVAAGGSMEGAILQDCRLGGDFLRKGPDLRGVQFISANLRGAWMSYSNFTGALFNGSDLRKAKLSSCILTNANFSFARMCDVKFRDNDIQTVKGIYRTSFRAVGRFGLPVDRILEEYPEQAAPMYRELVRYFSARALSEDASWAAYRASIQQHRLLRHNLNFNLIRTEQMMNSLMPNMTVVRSSSRVEYLMALFAWLKSGTVLLLTGYGEKPIRVLIAASCLIFAYAGLFSIPGATSGHGFTEALYFSMITFTTLGYGDMVPKGSFRLIAGSEALCGILFTGLFLFCIGRKSIIRG